jgi:hypothetical protein
VIGHKAKVRSEKAKRKSEKSALDQPDFNLLEFSKNKTDF